MAQNAQLDAPITGDPGYAAGYPLPMEGNGPLGQREAPVPYPPQWPPYYPPAKPARRWLPAAIIGAAIILAAALVTTALIVSGGSDNSAPASPAAPAPTAEPAAPANGDTDDATCEAWQTTKPALDAIPPLPAGWDWNTPNIDTYINNMSASITKALDLFEPQITAEPADVAGAARDYVAARRTELRMLQDHTYTTADGVEGNMAVAKLNQLCGVS